MAKIGHVHPAHQAAAHLGQPLVHRNPRPRAERLQRLLPGAQIIPLRPTSASSVWAPLQARPATARAVARRVNGTGPVQIQRQAAPPD